MALAKARSLSEIDSLVREAVVARLAADEFILDIASHDLSRAPLIRVGVQDVWARRYNSEFHRLNPVTAALKAHLDHSGIVVRRFADLSREPLAETRIEAIADAVYYLDKYFIPPEHADFVINSPGGSHNLRFPNLSEVSYAGGFLSKCLCESIRDTVVGTSIGGDKSLKVVLHGQAIFESKVIASQLIGHEHVQNVMDSTGIEPELTREEKS
jgi:hypothetical protein